MKKNIIKIIFFLILIIGISTFNDYGMSNDEIEEARHSVLYYREYVKLFNNGNDEKINDFYNMFYNSNYHPTIKNYKYKYYGAATQMFPIVIESIFKYKLSIPTYFYMRHLYTFLIFFIALIYFYLLLNKYIFKDKKYSMIGTVFLFLSPRIYGDAFYNIKDLMFMSLSIINYYYALEYINSKKISSSIKLAIISAFAVNCRVVGGITIFLAIVIKFILNIKNKKIMIVDIIKLLIIFYVIYIVITPSSWQNPFSFIFDTIRYFYNYQDPISKIKLYDFYNGKWISSTKLPWHYIPVWIFITTPIMYIVLFIVGIYKNVKELIKRKFKHLNIYILYLNLILLIILLFVMIFRPVLYGGWRHLYFIYPIIILNAIIGLESIAKKLKDKKLLIYIIVIINLILVSRIMIINHPYQSEYFSAIGKKYYVKNFEKNYYRISNTECLKYISNIDNNYIITVYAPFNVGSVKLLDDYSRFDVNEYNENSDYVIDTSIDGSKKPKKLYKTIKIKKLDGVRLYTIYKRR